MVLSARAEQGLGQQVRQDIWRMSGIRGEPGGGQPARRAGPLPGQAEAGGALHAWPIVRRSAGYRGENDYITFRSPGLAPTPPQGRSCPGTGYRAQVEARRAHGTSRLARVNPASSTRSSRRPDRHAARGKLSLTSTITLIRAADTFLTGARARKALRLLIAEAG